jgi:signal transduction histidine kinase
LSNLVSNAIRFTPRGTVSLHLWREGDRALLAVSDTGVGIDPSFEPHIFEPFRQESEGSARTHEGSGLGLSITRQLLEHMRGSIEVESTKGVGSTFTVQLPLWQGPRPDSAER